MSLFKTSPSVLWVFAATGLMTAAGCNQAVDRVGETVPVHGQITVDGKPMQTELGMITFHADKEKGNTLEVMPIGPIDPAGKYVVRTYGKEGAPPGWYRVLVVAHETTASDQGMPQPTGKILSPQKYGDQYTTDLVVEVVESPQPGAYDFDLKTE